MLADGAAVALGDSGDSVGVGVVTEGGHALSLGPGEEHAHAHAVVVGGDDVDLVAEGGSPSADGVAGGGSVPSGAGGVLHLLRGELTDYVGGAVYLEGAVLDVGGGAVDVGADRSAVDDAVDLDGGAERAAHAAGTGDGVVVADVADGQDVADDAVAVAVKVSDVGLDVVKDHGALELGALVGVEADVVGVLVEGQSGHIELTGGAVGGLTVEPDKGLILVGNGAVAAGVGSLAGGRVRSGGIGRRGVRRRGRGLAAGGEREHKHDREEQRKNLLHDNSPFSFRN